MRLQSGLALETQVLRLFEQRLLEHVRYFVPELRDEVVPLTQRPLPKFLGGYGDQREVFCSPDPMSLARPLERVMRQAQNCGVAFNERIFFALSFVFNLYLKVVRHRFRQLAEIFSSSRNHHASGDYAHSSLDACKALANDCVAVATLSQGYGFYQLFIMRTICFVLDFKMSELCICQKQSKHSTVFLCGQKNEILHLKLNSVTENIYLMFPENKLLIPIEKNTRALLNFCGEGTDHGHRRMRVLREKVSSIRLALLFSTSPDELCRFYPYRSESSTGAN